MQIQQQKQSDDLHSYMSLYPVLLNYNTLASVSSDKENSSSTLQQQQYSQCTVKKENTMIDQTSTLNNELRTSLLPTSSRSLLSMPSLPLPTSSTVVTSNQGGVREKLRGSRKRSLVSRSWNARFQELLQFRRVNNHCLVPRIYHENPKLSQWVQKQRHQRKRKIQGLFSTLSDERQELLDNMAGFCWDSHQAVWNERFQSLEVFHMNHGHCLVPSNHPDSSLCNWVRYQKKQFRLYQAGSKSSMDEERFLHLLSIGFE